MIHSTYSPCRIQNGLLEIDRKFHVGMELYTQRIGTPIVVVAPRLGSDGILMDAIRIPVSELPYQVEVVQCDSTYRLDHRDLPRLRQLVEEADLLYGTGFGLETLAIQLGKPFIPVLEYNLRTQLKIARLPVRGKIRRFVRTVKVIGRFLAEVRRLRRAQAIHCNGYPIYHQTRTFHDRCLLYLDSRMSDSMVISRERLEARLATLLSGRRPRLIFSGRYESMKGACDVVEVGLALHRQGVDFELDLFGKGELAPTMRSRVEEARASDRIRVRDAIPYPELVERSHESDLFVCCHVQDDPSCTYLEASGSGLVIMGYDNKMWRNFANQARNGHVSRMGRPEELAQAIKSILAKPEEMATRARRSREFALEHYFEREFSRRIDSIQEFLLESTA